MVDLGLGEYITQVPSTRYPVYTSGNAGEVWPEVAYPLTITLTRKAGEIASAQAAINAGIPISKPAHIVNQVCGSGLRAVISGYQSIKLLKIPTEFEGTHFNDGLPSSSDTL